MNSTLFFEEWFSLAGSVVINLLWQGTIIGLLVTVALALTHRRSPNARYAMACVGLALIAALLPVNFAWLATRDTPVSATADWQVAVEPSHYSALPGLALDPTDPTDPTDRSDPSDSSALERPARPSLSATQWYHRCLPWLGRLWAVGIVCFALYDLAGLFALRRLRANSQAVGEDIAALAQRVQERLGVRVRVQVRWLAGISSALVTGFFRTVILLPASMATRMTPDEVEAILAHEFAHIRRWDLWVNAFQRVVEALLFFHPVVWWLSSTIRNERELCCDELALRAYPDRAQYVRALLTLAETTESAKALALSSHGGSLVDRMGRILGGPGVRKRNVRGRMLVAIIGTCCAALPFFLATATEKLSVADSANVPEDIPTTGSNVLESMRAYDDAVLDNMVLEAHVTHPLIIEKLDSEPSLLQVRITRRGNTWAYRADLDDSQPPPSYVPHSEEHGLGLSADPASGDNIVARPLRTTLLSDPEFNGIYEEKVVYEVSPVGSVKESLSPNSVELARWPNPIHDWHIYVPVLASGRGFSLLLDEITETEVADDGLFHCKAVGVSPGSSGRASPATWDLLIEPDAGYLVRSAAASLPNGNVFWEFENEGLLETGKGSVPRSASFRYGGNQASEMYQGEGKTEIVYTGLDDGVDDALIAEARRLLNGPYPPGTRVSDRRGKATGYTVPSDNESLQPRIQESELSPTNITTDEIRAACIQQKEALQDVRGEYEVLTASSNTQVSGDFRVGRDGQFFFRETWWPHENDASTRESLVTAWNGQQYNRLFGSRQGEITTERFSTMPPWVVPTGFGDEPIIDQVIQRPENYVVLGEIEYEGARCVAVEGSGIVDSESFARGRVRLYLDVNRGFMPVRREVFGEDDVLHLVDDQFSYHSAIGLSNSSVYWLKQKRSRKRTLDGPIRTTIVSTSEVEFNPGLEESDFQIDWPPGVSINDVVLNRVYRSGEVEGPDAFHVEYPSSFSVTDSHTDLPSSPVDGGPEVQDSGVTSQAGVHPKTAGKISGIVVDESGSPLAGVEWRVWSRQTWHRTGGYWIFLVMSGVERVYTTGDDGRFELEIPAESRYDLLFDKKGFGPTLVYTLSPSSQENRVTMQRGVPVTASVTRPFETDLIGSVPVYLRLTDGINSAYNKQAMTLADDPNELTAFASVIPEPPADYPREHKQTKWQVICASNIVDIDVANNEPIDRIRFELSATVTRIPDQAYSEGYGGLLAPEPARGQLEAFEWNADSRKSSTTSGAEQESALAVIRAAEQAYEFAHVTAKMVAFEPDGAGVLKESGEFVHTEGNLGFYSPLQFDCLVDGRMGQSLRSFQERVSTDDRDLRYLGFVRRNAGQFTPSNGAVLPQTRLDKVEFTLLRGGINLFLPSYAGRGLSTYIQRIQPQMPAWRVLEHTETSLVIWIPTHDTRADHAQNEHSFVIGLDLTKGGNITRWEEWFDYWGPNRRLRQILHSGEFNQLNGLWFPTKLAVDVVNDDRAQRQVLIRREIAEFEWSEVNRKPEGEDFTLEFPPHVPVSESNWIKAIYRWATGNTN